MDKLGRCEIEVLGSEPADGGHIVHARFQGNPPQHPIAPASLVSGGAPRLELHRLDSLDGRSATFRVFERPAGPLPPGSYYLQQWWTQSQWAVATETSIMWHPATFEARDAVRHPVDPGAVPAVQPGEPANDVVDEGWDHQHCALGWETIDRDAQGAFSDGRVWLCAKCYERFILLDLLRIRGPRE